MARQEYSAHQKNIIRNYYDQLDTIMLTKLQELVTELYLAESATKRDKLWKRVEQAMIKLGIKEPLLSHILKAKDIELLAKNLQDWLKNTKAGR